MSLCTICLVLMITTNVSASMTLNLCIVHQEDIFTTESNLSRIVQDTIDVFRLEKKSSDLTFITNITSFTNFQLLQFSELGCTTLPAECQALITISDCSSSIHVTSWSSKYSIPHILITDTSCSNTLHYGIKLTPFSTSITGTIMAVITNEEWSEIVLLHDEFLDHYEKLEMVKHISNRYIGVICLLINTTVLTEDISNHLQTILNSQYRNIIVMVHSHVIPYIFQQAQQKSMLGSIFYWLIYSDSLIPESLIHANTNNSNIVVLKLLFPANHYLPCQESRGTCSSVNNEEILQLRLLDSMRMISEVITKDDLQELGQYENSTCNNDTNYKLYRGNITQRVLQIDIPGSSGRLNFDSRGYQVGTMYNICSVHDGLQGGFDEVGYWSPLEGLVLPQAKLYLNTFSDFGNKTLVIGTLQAIPFTVKTVVGNETIWDGFCIDILKEMAAKFNFKYVIKESDDKLWGAPEDDGRWNGIVGEVVRGVGLPVTFPSSQLVWNVKAYKTSQNKPNNAFGVGPFTITSIRETVIDFTKPYTEEGIGILTRRPDNESTKMFKMFTPFAPVVWSCIVIGVAVVGVLLYLVNRASPYSDHKLYPETPRMTLKESLWVVYGSYMEQGGEPHPRSISGRLILGFWWLFTILMASTYTANLAAFLTVTIAEKPINSLTELSQQDGIKPLAKYGSNLYTLFKEANGGIYGDIWEKMDGMPKLKNNNDALEYVIKGTTAFMTDRSQLEYIVLNDCETYSLADESFNTAGLGFIVPENAPFSDAFNYHIMKMQEAGLIDKWKQKWWPSSDKCSGSDRTSQAQTLDLESLAGPFFIFLSVAALAAVLLFIELCYYSETINNFVKCIQTGDEEDEVEPEKD